ncbi:leucyl aminopeptidase [Parafrankia irregularis]|uniref:Probable cytosol aminopeptidase n=1 Tax=Parafrankia irregularis TaxID=795642 RepID=A0A0S4QSX9_9ACTN|nr:MULTISPECIES: leucyl aminopeptidase [Parafrankia]MBE3205135.1 leucyl aminopeptidase [Parafrankia sp. CH37]CUU58637.1 leucyl aminopeptidase [Parafrankia irregularis]
MSTVAVASMADLAESRYRAPLVLVTSDDHPLLASVDQPATGREPAAEPAVAPGEVGAVGADCAVLVVVVASVDGAVVVPDRGRRACTRVGVDVDRLIENEGFRADTGGLLTVPLSRAERPWRLFLLGVGAGEVADWRSAGAVLARRAGAKGRPFVVADPDAERVYAFVEGHALASYRLADVVAGAVPGGDRAAGGSVAARVVAPSPDGPEAPGGRDQPAGQDVQPDGGQQDVPEPQPATADEAAADPRADRVLVLSLEQAGDPAVVDAVRRARVVADAVCLARDLINMPSLVKTPAWLAHQAKLVATQAGLDVAVLDRDDLVREGFGGLVAVGGGSPRPPFLVRLTYDGPPGPEGVEPGHRVLVGKGITFDSGGLSLKPSVSMASMKTDMSGAAAVLGTMAALPELAVPGKVTGLLCLAENLIGGSAMRPGDVITCWGGTTVEVLNTDAEGRLVLADGLAYATATLEPDQIVDLATLTGAITVALGRRTAGLFSSDDTLAAELAAASTAAGERVWRLPLTEEYRPAIDSPVADLANIGRAMEVNGGSITAALFLREFTGGRAWAHLDIAGTARADSDDGEISRGGTGWGVRTLIAYLAGPGSG